MTDEDVLNNLESIATSLRAIAKILLRATPRALFEESIGYSEYKSLEEELE